MSKSKYSPGPWKVEKHVKDLEIWNQNTHIATINHHYKYDDQPAMDKANAALIATAPDMLAWLETVVELDENNEPISDYGIKKLKELIKRARGAIDISSRLTRPEYSSVKDSCLEQALKDGPDEREYEPEDDI